MADGADVLDDFAKGSSQADPVARPCRLSPVACRAPTGRVRLTLSPVADPVALSRPCRPTCRPVATLSPCSGAVACENSAVDSLDIEGNGPQNQGAFPSDGGELR